MEFNKFIWENYKQSEQGKECISIFTEGNSHDVISRFGGKLPSDIEEVTDFIDELTEFSSEPELADNLSSEEATALFNRIADEGIKLTYEDGEIGYYDPKSFDFLVEIPILSTWLYFYYPDNFKPYFFVHKFSLLTRIADTFELS